MYFNREISLAFNLLVNHWGWACKLIDVVILQPSCYNHPCSWPPWRQLCLQSGWSCSYLFLILLLPFSLLWWCYTLVLGSSWKLSLSLPSTLPPCLVGVDCTCSQLICSWVKGVLDKFLTQVFSLLFSCAWLVLFCLVGLLLFPSWPPCNAVWLPSLTCCLSKSLLNFSFCLFRVLRCCFSLPTFIKSLHLSIHSLLKTLLSWSIHVSLWDFNMFRVLLIDLTLSLGNDLSALLIIWIPLGVLIFFAASYDEEEWGHLQLQMW